MGARMGWLGQPAAGEGEKETEGAGKRKGAVG